jgi:hypothetical protein
MPLQSITISVHVPRILPDDLALAEPCLVSEDSATHHVHRT